MTRILLLVGILVALRVLQPVMKILIALVAGKAVGKVALAKQPDTIHLVKADSSAWKNRAAAGAIGGGLRPCGFLDAGTYTIDPMPGVVVRLLAQPQESFYAAVYEHPKVGTWFELVSRYADGTGACFTTSKPTGLKSRPGHVMVNVPRTTPMALYERARAERPRGALAPATVENAVRDFEQGYADSMAWRKNEGVSTVEVTRVAINKMDQAA